MINYNVIASNPFFEAFNQSDLIGKLIFIGLITLSIVSWIILIHKTWVTQKAKQSANKFKKSFNSQKVNPLSLELDSVKDTGELHPFRNLYTILKKTTMDLLNKNRHFSEKGKASYLSSADIDYVEGHLATGIANQTKEMEKNLYILPTVVGLGPFLGLLGTVWGIITSFSDMQNQTSSMVLGGLSLALATTVLGLVDAIPALIGYNYLKNEIRDFQVDMDAFAHEILSSVEMQYRKVDED